jgi:hypothetical protein
MLKFRYNITYEDFVDMYKKQDGKCLICNTPKILGTKLGLNIDHCHVTLKVRGLLCRSCNTALGLLKEDKVVITNLLKYIEKK